MNDGVGDNGDFVGGEGASMHPHMSRHSCFSTHVSQSDEPCPILSREQLSPLRMFISVFISIKETISCHHLTCRKI